MKNIIKHVYLLALMLLCSLGGKAQEANILKLTDIRGNMAGKVSLPISIDNTCNDIVAFQFRLQVPQGVTIDTQSAQFTSRTESHSAIIQPNANGYVIMAFSPDNKPILGNSGKVMTIDLNIGTNFEPDDTCELVMSQVLISDRQGNNVLTNHLDSKLIIGEVTDFIVTDIDVSGNSYIPGKAIPISWVIKNQGGQSSTGGWGEQVSLIGNDGRKQLLGTVYYDGTLGANSSISRQADFIIPALPGIEGNAKIEVRIQPNADSGELPGHQSNNTTIGTKEITLEKALLLVVPSKVDESHLSLRCQLGRSGNWSEAQTFNISVQGDNRITFPTTVTIPQGQSSAYFYLTMTDDNIINEDSIFIVTAEGNGYDSTTSQIVIEDNEYPSLGISTSKSEVTEGESFQLTIIIPNALTTPLEVNLYSEKAEKFNYPSTISIPEGNTSTTITVEAIDDTDVNDTLDVMFTAEATRYNKSETLIIFVDNDMPDIEMTITPSAISESAGPTAVVATVRKLNKSGSKITVNLSDDSDGRLFYSTKTLIMEAGIEETQFSIGIIDNDIVDGNVDVNVTASIYISSCNCSAKGTSGGSVTKTFTVLDDDGPTLKLTPQSTILLEGSNNNRLIIERNTAISSPLTIALSSDHEELLDYEHSITIPAGQKSTIVMIAIPDNDLQGDSKTITFTAVADGYTKGVCWVTLSDQTLPDVRITSLTTDKGSYETGSEMEVSISVVNEGKALFKAPAEIILYFNNDNTILPSLYLQEDLQPGASSLIKKTITLPTHIGVSTIKAEINHSHSVEEILYVNNLSESVNIQLLAPFTATVSPEKGTYLKGDTVKLSGVVTGNRAANTDVEVYITQGSIRQTIIAHTDYNGNFTTEWLPYTSQLGQFGTGACYPGERLTEQQSFVNILGLRRKTNDYITCETLVNETYTGKIVIENPGVVDQTLNAIEILEKPVNCEVRFETPEKIIGGKTAIINYSLTGNEITDGNDWEDLKLKLSTSEGSTLDIDMYYFCRSPKGALEANINSIKTTMAKGTSRDYAFTIINRGKGETGRITLSLPNVKWMKAVTPIEMESLAYGESAEIILRLTPTDDMPLNVPITGRIALNCQNGNGLPISYNIEPVSNSKGTLTIDVVDEYSYYTVSPSPNNVRAKTLALAETNMPHVSGATVEIKHPITGAIIANGTTDSRGLFTTDISEGYYTLTVTESNHESYSGTVQIDPGITNLQNIFISFKAITYSWEVVETEVKDEYHIETKVTYETNVPKPVVIITLPSEEPQLNTIIPIVVTNKGLITAFNPSFALSCDDGYEIELLNDEELSSLAPQQSHIYYAVLKMSSSNPNLIKRRVESESSPNPCKGLYAHWWGHYICGTEDKFLEEFARGKWGNCFGNQVVGDAPAGIWGDSNRNGLNGGKGRGPAAPNTITNPSVSSGIYYHTSPPGTSTSVKYCDPDWKAIANAVIPCVKDFYNNCLKKGDNTIIDAIHLIDNINDDKISLGNGIMGNTVEETLEEIADKVKKTGKTLYKCGEAIGECIAAAVIISKGGHAKAIQKKNRSASKKLTALDQLVGSMRQLQQSLFVYHDFQVELWGDSEWLSCNNDEVLSFLEALSDASQNGMYIINDNIINNKPSNITINQVNSFVERLNNTTRKNFLSETDTNYVHVERLNSMLQLIQDGKEQAKMNGYNNVCDWYEYNVALIESQLEEQKNSVCANITLQFSQTMTMTRQAFRGSLSVFNGHDTNAMEDVKFNLEIRDENGNIATSHEFQVNAESLNNFSGELSLSSGWSLPAQQSGKATILFIPTKYAAPTEDKVYTFGGTLSYVDPFTGFTVSRDLYPVALTVKPSPNLEMTYFMQRDILGDDALTLDVVEPSVPAEFALVIKNNGYGNATNVRMVTEQPKIIDNEKGLYIQFNLISSILNGKGTNLALGQSASTDFGNIAAHSTAYAQWMFESSLLGHFTGYDINATHVSSYGNADLSLLDTVSIHELIHGFNIERDGSQNARAFLVNDIVDAYDLPDEIYFSDGTQQHVSIAHEANFIKQGNAEWVLTVSVSKSGWNYGSIIDPTHGKQKLVGITRMSDGKTLCVDNFWQTDRTLLDGKEWLYENNLHFVDSIGIEQEQYRLTFEPIPEVNLAVKELTGAPTIDTIATEPIQTIHVLFNKNIDASTFTTSDLQICHQGTELDVSKINIQKINNQQFDLNLNGLAIADGYYTLLVKTEEIVDEDGYKGEVGYRIEWIQYAGGKVYFSAKPSPEDAGIVTPSNGKADYNSTVIFTAEPLEGYEFSNWSIEETEVTRQIEYETQITEACILTANFIPKQYYITMKYNDEEGSIEGGGSGYYNYCQEVTLKAIPKPRWAFKCWKIDGEEIASTETINIQIKQAVEIEPVFTYFSILLGDVNNDGIVNITDLVGIVNYILNKEQEVFIFKNADISQDNNITIVDVIGIINLILK